MLSILPYPSLCILAYLPSIIIIIVAARASTLSILPSLSRCAKPRPPSAHVSQLLLKSYMLFPSPHFFLSFSSSFARASVLFQ
ncbi:hypothetical protein BKA62DRAFT_719604 [Auriculariales sp. MPI-PUGE-AT-0066]|nr:hypothetical protein BKA62DRAFT_719604 [Auriculariales sp. MPI-PUGE-AT-0066]